MATDDLSGQAPEDDSVRDALERLNERSREGYRKLYRKELAQEEEIDRDIARRMAVQSILIRGTKYDAGMADLTREELDAKLATTDAKLAGAVASIEGKIDTMLARMEGLDSRVELRFQHIEQNTKGVKGTIIGTGVAIAAVIATVLGLMLASFESGKGTATALVQATEQMKQTQAEMKAIAASLAASGKK